MKKFLPCLLSLWCGMPILASGQAIRTAILPAQGSQANIRILNDSLSKGYTNITLRWQTLVNGLLRQKGTVPGLALFPGRARTVRLPLTQPAPGDEVFIKVEYRAAPSSQPPLAVQFLQWKSWNGDLSIPAAGELRFTDSNDIFTVSSPTLLLSFDKETGWIQQYAVDHFTLVADTNGLRPALPNAPHLQLFSTSTGSQMAIVRAEYTLPEISCLLHLSYAINAAGVLLVEQTIETDTTRPDSLVHPIDRLGTNWTLPPGYDSVAWYGFAAHNDDDTDSLPSLHSVRLFTPPGQSAQSPFLSTKVRWWNIRDHDGKGFRITADSNFLYKISLSPTGTLLQIDDHLVPLSTTPIHHHYGYKVTPLMSEGLLNRFNHGLKSAPRLPLHR